MRIGDLKVRLGSSVEIFKDIRGTIKVSTKEDDFYIIEEDDGTYTLEDEDEILENSKNVSDIIEKIEEYV